jgi:hypothetical protein
MKVKIKSFVDVDVKTKGIEFGVRSPNDKKQLGDFYLTNTGLKWCLGKTDKKNGIGIKWEDFMDLMSSKDTLKRALKAARQPIEN